MEIAFCTDTNYVMPCGVAMTSICENNKEEDIIFHLVITDEGTAPDEVEKKVSPLRDIAVKYAKNVEVYRMDAEKIKGFTCSGAGYISTTAFARIFLPEILPDSIKKVLYLDGDLICYGNLQELWETELKPECPLAAVVDCNHATPEWYIDNNIDYLDFYCNSGVLLFNLDCWRRNNYISLTVNSAIEHRFPFLDQDTLNYVFHGKILFLPVKYNVLLLYYLDGIGRCQISKEYYEEVKEACKNPIIIHYISSNKPWINERCPYRDVWERYKNMTIWKDAIQEEAVVRFDRSYIYKELEDSYWSDTALFKEEIKPFLRLFRIAVKIKNKSSVLKISSAFLNTFAGILEKIYKWKQ